MIKVSVDAYDLEWRPGQHFFLRFFAFGPHAFTSHPFTVANAFPSTRKQLSLSAKEAQVPTTAPSPTAQELVFFMRPRSGISARFASSTSSGKNVVVPISLDGPYGGLPRSVRPYDSVVLLAGGSGGTFILSVLDDLVRGFEDGEGDGNATRATEILVVWATRHAGQ
jgi:hypothetical protein